MAALAMAQAQDMAHMVLKARNKAPGTKTKA